MPLIYVDRPSLPTRMRGICDDNEFLLAENQERKFIISLLRDAHGVATLICTPGLGPYRFFVTTSVTCESSR